MKKTNKIFTGLGAVAAVVAPLAGVISCGSTGVDNSNVVVIKTTWSATGPQMKALETVVKEYNATQSKKAGYKEVKIVHFQGGYGDILPMELKEIKNNNMKNVANLFIDYPDALGQLTGYKRVLNFNEHGLERDLFETKFTDVNSSIGGLDANGFYAVPIAKSTDMMTFNIPVLAHVVKTMVAAGATFTPGTEGATKAIDDYIKAAAITDTPESKEVAHIATMWKKDANAPANLNITIDENTFKTHKTTFDFVAKAQSMFYQTAKDTTQHIMGVDASTNLTYTMSYAAAGYDMDKFLFTKNAKGNIDYKYTEDGDQKTALKEVIDILKPAMDNGGVFVNGGGTYTSTELIKHKYAISVGSTAGYSKNFQGTNTGSKVVNTEGGGEHVLGYYDKPIKAPSGDNASKSGVIAETNDKYGNAIYDSDHTGEIGSHDMRITTKTTADNIKAAVAANATDTIGYIAQWKDSAKNYFTDGEHAFDLPKYKKYAVYIPVNKVTDKTVYREDSLQEEEIVTSTAPLSIDDTNMTNKVLMSQGPSMLGIKTNNTMDNASTMFVKWFSDINNKITSEEGTMSVAAYFAEEASYIVPFKGAFDGTTNLKGGQKIAFDAFKLINGDTGGTIFESPVDMYSGRIRKSVFDIAIREHWSGVLHSTDGTISAEDVYNKIKDLTNAELA